MAGPSSSSGPSTTLIANANSTSITFKKTIVLSTVDQNNNNSSVTESTYTVSGPVSQGVSPIFISGTQKAVIPLTTATGNGAPYLKIHFPNSSSPNTMYITYCVANSFMMDGFYDYKTGVPASYFNALRTWINTNPVTGGQYLNGTPILRGRTLKFSAYGSSTNKPANSVTFFVKFEGTYGTAVVTTGPSGPSSEAA
jgi:hypothetical protein